MKRAALMVMAIACAGLLGACDEEKTASGPDPRIDGVAPQVVRAPDLTILEKVVVVDVSTPAPAPVATAPATAPTDTAVETAPAPTPIPDSPPPADSPAPPPADSPAPPPPQ